MKTNSCNARRWLSPLLLATCGLLYASPVPAHDDDPGRRPGFFSRLFHGSHKHKAPPRIVVEPQVVERITTVTYPDGRVERYVNTPPPPSESVVREEAPTPPVPSYSMRSVRERPVTDVTVEPREPGLRLPEGYKATHAPRVSSRPQVEDSVATEERSLPNTITQAPPRRPQEARPKSLAQANTESRINREPENSPPQPRPAPAEKKIKQGSKAPRSNAGSSRELTGAAPENFLEEAPASKAIGTVQKKFDHAPTPAMKSTSSEDATPPQKMLVGAKTDAPADLPPAKSAKDPSKTNSPVAEGKNYPLASRAEKPGFLKSPFKPFNELDATGLASGSLARDPTTGKIFRVP